MTLGDPAEAGQSRNALEEEEHIEPAQSVLVHSRVTAYPGQLRQASSLPTMASLGAHRATECRDNLARQETSGHLGLSQPWQPEALGLLARVSS